MSKRALLSLGLGACAWVGLLVAGFALLQRYAAMSGAAQPPSADIHQFVAQHRQPGRGLLVIAVHPQCPCTRASLAELGDLLARSHGSCTAVVVEYAPQVSTADWTSSPHEINLGGAPVPVLVDRGGVIAAALGARTSGHVVFADKEGAIRFHGGLTLSRGHRGRSPAQDAILAMLHGASPAIHTAPVYGCSLGPECKPGGPS